MERACGDRLERDVSGDVVERQVLWALVRSLPPRQRAVVVLRFYEDMGEAQVAEVLGCSVGTVKSQCSRAIASLRARMCDETPPLLAAGGS